MKFIIALLLVSLVAAVPYESVDEVDRDLEEWDRTFGSLYKRDDTGGGGKIDLNQFWLAIDTNQDDVATYKELEDFAADPDPVEVKNTINQLLKQCDANGDKKITKDEFMKGAAKGMQ